MLLTGALAALGVGAAAGPASAAIWTPIASGTTDDITAIEYQGPDRFWYTTGSGKIFKRIAGTFTQVQSPVATVFRDIEFQQGGDVGLAVGTNGAVYRSTNAGNTWSAVAVLSASNPLDANDCDEAVQQIGDVESVRFSGDGTRAWLAAGGSQIALSTGTNLTVGSAWSDANRSGTTCKIDLDIDDTFPVPGGDSVYFVSKYFGVVFSSTNNLGTTAQEKAGDAGNGFQHTRRLAGDPANPNRQWSVAPGGGGGSYYGRTETGWSNADDWAIANPEARGLDRAYDVDYAGGTVLAAGEAGMILHGTDGRNFFFDDAPGLTEDWHAVSLADGANGAVGGSNGTLVVTTQANVLPDIVKPTGTIAGPAEARAGQPVAFTLNAADEGGSGLNPASIAWTSAGLPAQGGNPAAFTFPSPGFYSVTVTFADHAGNVGEATASITIAKAAKAPALPVSFTGPGSKLSAKLVGKKIRVTMKGAITPPAGSGRAACSGKVTLRIKKGKRTMSDSKVKLKFKGGKCRFAKTVNLRKKKVGKTDRLRLTISHPGNSVLRKGSASRTLVIRR